MKWGLKSLEISPETIQTEDNLLFYCHMLDDQEEVTVRLPSKPPNFMRLLKPKEIRRFILHTWRLSKHNELWLRFTTLITLHSWQCSGYKWQNENQCMQRWWICRHSGAEIKLTIDTNGSGSVSCFFSSSAESTQPCLSIISKNTWKITMQCIRVGSSHLINVIINDSDL